MRSTPGLDRCLLFALSIAGCGHNAAPSSEIVGPYTGATTRFVVDQLTLPASDQDFSEDLDGDGAPDNSFSAVQAVWKQDNESVQPSVDAMLAAGRLAPVV